MPELPIWHVMCSDRPVDAHSISYVGASGINRGMTQSHYGTCCPTSQYGSRLIGLSDKTLSRVPIGCLDRPDIDTCQPAGFFFVGL